MTADHSTAKISDFSIANRDKSEIVEHRKTMSQWEPAELLAAVTVQYASPEILKNEPLSPASDVFSYSILLYVLYCNELLIYRWEIFANKKPFDGINPVGLDTKIVQGERPEPMPSKITPQLTEAILMGWNVDANQRPTMQKMAQVLSSVPSEQPVKFKKQYTMSTQIDWEVG